MTSAEREMLTPIIARRQGRTTSIIVSLNAPRLLKLSRSSLMCLSCHVDKSPSAQCVGMRPIANFEKSRIQTLEWRVNETSFWQDSMLKFMASGKEELSFVHACSLSVVKLKGWHVPYAWKRWSSSTKWIDHKWNIPDVSSERLDFERSNRWRITGRR